MGKTYGNGCDQGGGVRQEKDKQRKAAGIQERLGYEHRQVLPKGPIPDRVALQDRGLIPTPVNLGLSPQSNGLICRKQDQGRKT